MSDVKTLGFSDYTETRLLREGIHTVEQLQNLSDDKLLQIPGIGNLALKEIREKVEPIPSKCCELKAYLDSQLRDESKATQDYADAAEKMGQLRGKVGLADALSDTITKISDDEFKHYLLLIAMSEILEEECNCGSPLD